MTVPTFTFAQWRSHATLFLQIAALSQSLDRSNNLLEYLHPVTLDVDHGGDVVGTLLVQIVRDAYFAAAAQNLVPGSFKQFVVAQISETLARIDDAIALGQTMTAGTMPVLLAQYHQRFFAAHATFPYTDPTTVWDMPAIPVGASTDGAVAGYLFAIAEEIISGEDMYRIDERARLVQAQSFFEEHTVPRSARP